MTKQDPLPTSQLASRLAVSREHTIVATLRSVACPPAVPFGSKLQDLDLLGAILFLDSVGAGCSTLLVQLTPHGAMEFLFEDRLGLDSLELGLEVPGRIRARVASATGIGHIVAHVLDLLAVTAPIDNPVSRNFQAVTHIFIQEHW